MPKHLYTLVLALVVLGSAALLGVRTEVGGTACDDSQGCGTHTVEPVSLPVHGRGVDKIIADWRDGRSL